MCEQKTSLSETLVRNRRNWRLTRLYDQEKLPFTAQNDVACSNCNESRPFGGLDTIEIEDHDGTLLILCRPCFKAMFHMGPAELNPQLYFA